MSFETLEARELLSITVNTLVDENNGIGVGGISLREAVAAAAATDTINFSVTGTISLTSLGHITINKNLTIVGPGAKLLTIRAYDPDANGTSDGDGSRVFNIDDSNAANILSVSLNGLTLTNGDSLTSGGAIRNTENLIVSDSTISGNWSSTRGGGIYSTGANSQLTLLRTVVSGNASMNNGGGVAMLFGGTSIDQSTISGNIGTFSGGGVFQYGGQLNLTRSTISGNSTSNRGGGIYTALGTHTISESLIVDNASTVSGISRGGGGIGKYGGSLTITNSTLSGNRSWQNGGGISNYGGTLAVRHSTVTLNWADVDTVGGGLGGGVVVGSGAVSLDHTIVSGNLRGFGSRDDVSGSVALSFSLIGDNTGATITNNGGNQIGTGAAPINAMLGPLIDNGGPTRLHALLAGSPAVDMGNSMIVTPPASDQRGAPFARIADGDGVGGARIDIGAYERQTVSGLNLVVDTLVDEYDSNFAAGDLSLREAISLANGSVGPDVITFAAALTAGGPATILLMQGELVISDSVTINGPNDLSLTIDASGNDPTPNSNNGDGSRVFHIDNGHVSLGDVAINLLILTGGDAAGSGGAIFTRENLSLLYSTITGNATSVNQFAAGGGAIYSSAGGVAPNSLSLLYTTVSNNTAVSAEGGGIRKRYGSLFVLGSTITGNFAAGTGGGISAGYGNADVTIGQSILSSNTAGSGGGGVFLINTVAVISDSTIQGNQGNPGGGGLYSANNNLTINRSRITGNSAVDGGGILSIGSISLTDSTISGNSATYGGGISHNQGSLNVTRSTISGNQASQGGGILSETSVGFSTSIASSTISLNVATVVGGGVFNAAGNAFIRHGTITANQAPASAGGGIASQASGTLTFLTSTIVYNNVFGNDVQFVGGATNTFASGGYNLIGSGNALGVYFQGGDQAGTGNAMLGPLADHGGPTKTHALLPGSTAIDAGDNGNPPPSIDQRGFARVFDGDGVGGARIDIGAYERQVLPGLSLVVDTLADENDQVYSPGDLSLREAVALANGSVGADTITFAPALTAGGLSTIHLSLGELFIDESLTINGPGANLLRIDASDNDPTPALKNGDGSRVFNINNVNSSILDVTISELMLNGGDAGGAGGAILTRENLTIENSIISGNASSSGGIAGGGAIYSSEFGTTLIVRDSSVSFNSATNSEGGGIRVRFGSLLVERSTIANNNANSVGGGISAAPSGGTVEIRDTTLSGNTSGTGAPGNYGGGGLFLFDALATITGSTISGNDAYGTGGGIDAHLGSLTIEDSTISDNESANSQGGGIRQKYGNLTIDRSIIAGNISSTSGGGVSVGGGTTVVIRDSTINGNSATVQGGGIAVDSAAMPMSIVSSTLSGNTAIHGGGIYSLGGSLTVAGSRISGNSAVFGAGILGRNGLLTITNSTLVKNEAGDNGGAILSAYSTLLLTSSTISGNSSDGFFGGGLFSYHSTATVSSSTISGNSTAGNGGGVYKYFGNLTVSHSTITSNIADVDAGGTNFGGGIAGRGTSAQLSHTIVADNFRNGLVTRSDLFGSFTLAFSLIGVNSNTTLTGAPIGMPDANGNLIGTTALPINPLLGPLEVNGGSSQTHTLLPGSPAIDAGDPGIVFDPDMFDQRGAPFLRVVDGDAVPGARIDVGAVERQPIPSAVFGDYNQDGTVNAADYTVWRNSLGLSGLVPYSGADGDGDGMVDLDDYGVWKSNFGSSVPMVGSGGGGAVSAVAEGAEIQETAALSVSAKVAVSMAEVERSPLEHSARPYPSAMAALGAQRDEALLAWLTRHADSRLNNAGCEALGLAEVASSPVAPGLPTGLSYDDWELVLESIVRRS